MDCLKSKLNHEYSRDEVDLIEDLVIDLFAPVLSRNGVPVDTASMQKQREFLESIWGKLVSLDRKSVSNILTDPEALGSFAVASTRG